MTVRNSTKVVLLGFVLVLHAASVHAEQKGVIIVHPENTVTLGISEIRNIFLDQFIKAETNNRFIPILSFENIELRTRFNKQILKKNNKQVRAFWAKKIFTGKGAPPVEMKNNDLIKTVSQNKAAIGMVSWDSITNDDVRVILEF